MIKQIPNLITLLNLLFGCLAIVAIMGVHPRFVAHEEMYQIQGMENLYWGSLFIFIAAVCDVLDGWAARLLNAASPIGLQLDSLADLVSFGLAPSLIVYQLLWRSYMMEPGAIDTPMLVLVPAFLIVLAGAYRLSRFNVSKSEDGFQGYFLGVPIPAVGLAIATLPLALYQNYEVVGQLLENRWILYALIATFSYLMISNHKFLKWNTGGRALKSYWPQILLLLIAIIGFVFLNFGAGIIVFIAYILFSLLYKFKLESTTD